MIIVGPDHYIEQIRVEVELFGRVSVIIRILENARKNLSKREFRQVLIHADRYYMVTGVDTK